MFKSFKIKTAVLICLAFVFRLVFVNIGAYASISSSNKQLLKNHSSTVLKKKRRKINEASVQSLYANEQSVQELTEETQENEENVSQLKKLNLLFTLYSFLKATFDIPKSFVSYDQIKCQLQPKKYLALSVIRI